jgi:hypothetical protein
MGSVPAMLKTLSPEDVLPLLVAILSDPSAILLPIIFMNERALHE